MTPFNPSLIESHASSGVRAPLMVSPPSSVTSAVATLTSALCLWRRLLCAAGAIVLIAGCTGGVRHPISCSQVESLRLGMPATEVRQLLGQATGELTQTDRLIDAANRGGIPGYKAYGLETHYMSYHDNKMWSARQDTVWAVLYQDKLFSVRAHRRYSTLVPIEAFVLERSPKDPESAITRRRGPAFAAVFPCEARQ